ncbi:MAG: peptide chain release factor N(5)-glutamine methyltransferase [Steroidobacteraceae bacterium]
MTPEAALGQSGDNTLATLIAAGTARLASTSPSARLDAELLLAKATSQTRTALSMSPEQQVPADQCATYRSLIYRRSQGEPVAYLLGTQDFWTLTLTVTPAVLIPRPETELVVERALSHLPPGVTASVLDLATGSGAIALAIAVERPTVAVLGTDLSAEALQVASGNAARLGLDRVRFRAGSWFDPVGTQRFTVITSNPPYVAAGDPNLEPAVLAHEPTLALLAGSNGYAALEEITAGAPDHLEPYGWLILEHGSQQAPRARNLLEQAGFRHVRSHADLAGHDRVTEGQWFQRNS